MNLKNQKQQEIERLIEKGFRRMKVAIGVVILSKVAIDFVQMFPNAITGLFSWYWEPKQLPKSSKENLAKLVPLLNVSDVILPDCANL